MSEDEACIEIGELVYDGWSDDEIAEMARKKAAEFRVEFNAAIALLSNGVTYAYSIASAAPQPDTKQE